MQQHPVCARAMLEGIPYLQSALEIPYSHHEKWDGSGYPCGLMRDEIPMSARIFAIIDVWDALTSDRPYRSAWSSEQALAYIQTQAGKQFDPIVTNTFLGMIAETQGKNAELH
jgi:HD-GYP domain-containing protein (c-di-GMP phosphodiesterase class II)